MVYLPSERQPGVTFFCRSVFGKLADFSAPSIAAGSLRIPGPLERERQLALEVVVRFSLCPGLD